MEKCLESLLIGEHASIGEALAALHQDSVHGALMVDRRRRLVGTISDAEIHRALLDGRSLSDPVAPFVTHGATAIEAGVARAHVLDLMRALSVPQIPVVDEAGRVVGIHLERELIGIRERANWALILAGGRGTRLAPLTDHVPKPMLRVAGRPILERLVLHLVGAGIRRIFLAVNYLSHLIEQHFGDGSGFGCSIEYLREEPDRPLGTGGPLGLLHRLGHAPSHPLLVLNGDLVTEFPVADLLAKHAAHDDAVATLAYSLHTHQVPFGVLETRSDRLLRLVEKPVASWQVNAGIYVLQPHLLRRIPDRGQFPITALVEDCIHRGERVNVWRIPEDWQDIGRPAELAGARGQW